MRLNAQIEKYKEILSEDVDYVGTRLHVGIFAMRHGKRSIILRVDERMNAMSSYMPNDCLNHFDMQSIEKKIKGNFSTEVNLDWKVIKDWKEQFN